MGLKLSQNIKCIHDEFLNTLNQRIYSKNCNPFDPTDDDFVQEYVVFMDCVGYMDRKLARLFRNVFDYCYNLDSFFKVIFLDVRLRIELVLDHVFLLPSTIPQVVLVLSKLFVRPAISKEIQKKYEQLLKLFDDEIRTVNVSDLSRSPRLNIAYV